MEHVPTIRALCGGRGGKRALVARQPLLLSCRLSCSETTMSGPKGPPATIAGGPSKRLPRPPRDPWRRGNKEVSRARCALCAPAYAPPRAPSVRRIDPPRAHCCPHCAQASALNVIGHDTIFDMKSARGLGDERDEAIGRQDESRAALAPLRRTCDR